MHTNKVCPIARRTMAVGASMIAIMLALATRVSAQEICGNGTTFTVNLPSVYTAGHSDSVTLPNGCRVYALLVSGYSRNPALDEASFFNLAKFVMENDGYVHWAWWNNLLREYMAGPLHPEETITVPLLGELAVSPGSLLGTHLLGFGPIDLPAGVPKAVPEEDFQFQADARRMLEAIRAHNPNAIIVVAGHSMGGGAVARLGAGATVDIDLLAPIDPVGNRTTPTGRFNPSGLDRTYNWTRWRATREWRGFRRNDCVRGPLGFCENFGTFFRPSYRCAPTGGFLSWPVIPGSWAPILCPGPIPDTGTQVSFSGRIKRLYHRWQQEFTFPFDYFEDYYFRHWSSLNVGSLTESRNIQRPVSRNAAGESNPNKTCASILDADPRDPFRICNPTDGHGEIIGFRAPTPDQPNPPGPNIPVAPLSNQLLGVSDTTDRRQLLLAMRDSDTTWPHRPINPDLDMVSADMIAIVDHLLAQQPPLSTPPTITSTVTPDANDHGWHNENAVVTLSATAGSATVAHIEYTTTGAQAQATTTHPGETVDVVISAEGDTVVTFLARDTAGNVSDAGEVTIRLDKTPPIVTASVTPEANANGWHNVDVTVTFSADDDRSGVLAVDPGVTLTNEGAAQEAVGTATDRAGNTTAATVPVNIDKTAPVLEGLPLSPCILRPPRHQLVQVAEISASDSLSGVDLHAVVVSGTSNEPEIGTRPGDRYAPDVIVIDGVVQLRSEFSGPIPSRVYTVTASAVDLAGNSAQQSALCYVTKPPTRKPGTKPQ